MSSQKHAGCYLNRMSFQDSATSVKEYRLSRELAAGSKQGHLNSAVPWSGQGPSPVHFNHRLSIDFNELWIPFLFFRSNWIKHTPTYLLAFPQPPPHPSKHTPFWISSRETTSFGVKGSLHTPKFHKKQCRNCDNWAAIFSNPPKTCPRKMAKNNSVSSLLYDRL